MKKVVLYGAGKRGRKIAKLMKEKGIEIYGFCDSNKKGKVELEVGWAVPIYPIEEIKKNKEECIVVITIANLEDSNQVKEYVEQLGIKISSVKNVINLQEDVVTYNREEIANFHINGMEKYFEAAEKECNLKVFWGEDSVFFKMFSKLDTKRIVELACGRGRHVPQYFNKAESITLVDVLEKNIELCRERFKDEKKIDYYVNNGHDLKDLETESYTALFTYDAMVHFESIDIFEYLKETERILKRGGKALFHHSNNSKDYRTKFFTDANGRNYMSKDLFAHLADRAGLEILEQQVIDWANVEGLDCVTLVEKKIPM